MATLQCAGNRRSGLIEVRDIPGEAPWGPGATGTARWRGVHLAVPVSGYAFAGGRREVTRVDVSVDGGDSWRQATLLEDQGRWAWRLWQATVELSPGEHEIIARAWDNAANTPERPETVWNPKGYVNNSWARIRLIIT